MLQTLTAHTNLLAHESVVLYPTYGVLDSDGVTWRIPIAGTVHEPGAVGLTKRILIRLLQRVMRADKAELQGEIFQQRIAGFIAASQKGKRVAVQVGQRVQPLAKKSTRLGFVSGVLRVSVGEMHELRRDGDLTDSTLALRLASPYEAHGAIAARAQLLPAAGVSVISDIDDTIKHTEVTDRRALLRNTFLRDFLPIHGMADVYQRWSEHGAVFHYVSSSPWQLYQPLADFCEQHGFPAGSFHLRAFRLRDHMLRRLFLVRRPVKGLMIKSLLTTFPQRRFYLVGDSGERDPEIYGAMARHFPRQVAGIFIRELSERPLDRRRLVKAFRHVSPAKWSIFQHPDQLAERLDAEPAAP